MYIFVSRVSYEVLGLLYPICATHTYINPFLFRRQIFELSFDIASETWLTLDIARIFPAVPPSFTVQHLH